MGDPYSLEVSVILACELHYSPNFIWGWYGWNFAKLQIADGKLPAFYLPGPKPIRIQRNIFKQTKTILIWTRLLNDELVLASWCLYFAKKVVIVIVIVILIWTRLLNIELMFLHCLRKSGSRNSTHNKWNIHARVIHYMGNWCCMVDKYR